MVSKYKPKWFDTAIQSWETYSSNAILRVFKVCNCSTSKLHVKCQSLDAYNDTKRQSVPPCYIITLLCLTYPALPYVESPSFCLSVWLLSLPLPLFLIIIIIIIIIITTIIMTLFHKYSEISNYYYYYYYYYLYLSADSIPLTYKWTPALP